MMQQMSQPMWERILQIVIDVRGLKTAVDQSTVRPDQPIDQWASLDSLDAVEIQLMIEEQFDVELEPGALSKVKTIDDCVSLIEAAQSKHA